MHKRIPRYRRNVEWRLVLALRHHSSLHQLERTESYISWNELAKVFKSSSGAALAAACSATSSLAFENSGMNTINLLTPLKETFVYKAKPITDSSAFLAIDRQTLSEQASLSLLERSQDLRWRTGEPFTVHKLRTIYRNAKVRKKEVRLLTKGETKEQITNSKKLE